MPAGIEIRTVETDLNTVKGWFVKARSRASTTGRWWLATAAVAVGVLVGATLLAWSADRPEGLRAEPSAVAFGPHDVGTASTQTVTDRRRHTRLASISIEGEHAEDFAVSDVSTCTPGPIVKGHSCTLVVGFAPTAPGERTASVSVMGLASGAPIRLHGTGVSTP